MVSREVIAELVEVMRPGRFFHSAWMRITIARIRRSGLCSKKILDGRPVLCKLLCFSHHSFIPFRLWVNRAQRHALLAFQSGMQDDFRAFRGAREIPVLRNREVMSDGEIEAYVRPRYTQPLSNKASCDTGFIKP